MSIGVVDQIVNYKIIQDKINQLKNIPIKIGKRKVDGGWDGWRKNNVEHDGYFSNVSDWDSLLNDSNSFFDEIGTLKMPAFITDNIANIGSNEIILKKYLKDKWRQVQSYLAIKLLYDSFSSISGFSRGDIIESFLTYALKSIEGENIGNFYPGNKPNPAIKLKTITRVITEPGMGKAGGTQKGDIIVEGISKVDNKKTSYVFSVKSSGSTLGTLIAAPKEISVDYKEYMGKAMEEYLKFLDKECKEVLKIELKGNFEGLYNSLSKELLSLGKRKIPEKISLSQIGREDVLIAMMGQTIAENRYQILKDFKLEDKQELNDELDNFFTEFARQTIYYMATKGNISLGKSTAIEGQATQVDYSLYIEKITNIDHLKNWYVHPLNPEHKDIKAAKISEKQIIDHIINMINIEGKIQFKRSQVVTKIVKDLKDNHNILLTSKEKSLLNHPSHKDKINTDFSFFNEHIQEVLASNYMDIIIATNTYAEMKETKAFAKEAGKIDPKTKVVNFLELTTSAALRNDDARLKKLILIEKSK